MTPDKIKGTPDAWENGDLGRDADHVRRTPREQEKELLEETLDLQMISIRLQKQLIVELKFIAQFHGIGYQPLIRDVLGRFTRHEMVSIAKQLQKKQEAAAALAVPDGRKRKRA